MLGARVCSLQRSTLSCLSGDQPRCRKCRSVLPGRADRSWFGRFVRCAPVQRGTPTLVRLRSAILGRAVPVGQWGGRLRGSRRGGVEGRPASSRWEASAGIARRGAHYARSTWRNCSSTPSSASSFAICWTNSAHRLRRSSIHGQRTTSQRTSSCVNTTFSPRRDLWSPARGAGSRNGDGSH
jgi:hypothetical protein